MGLRVSVNVGVDVSGPIVDVLLGTSVAVEPVAVWVGNGVRVLVVVAYRVWLGEGTGVPVHVVVGVVV